jgi:MoxR-like ATPase
MLQVQVDYPTEEEEFAIVRQTDVSRPPEIGRVLSREELVRLQHVVRRLPAADHVLRYAMTLTRATRPGAPDAPEFVRDYVTWGAGPRASQHLVLAAKARALLHGREHVSLDDVRAVTRPVLRHRVVTNFNAEADGMTADRIITRLLETVPADAVGTLSLGRLPQIFAGAREAT